MTNNDSREKRKNFWPISAWAIWLLTAMATLSFVIFRPGPRQDARTPVMVSEAQRAEILAVMRDNLVWMEKALSAFEAGAARKKALASELACPPSLKPIMGDLRSAEWLSVGHALHSECLEFINALKEEASSASAATHLRGVTRACVACHQNFRLEGRVDPLWGL
jgi:hypothetical protein